MKKISLIIVLILILTSFYKINEINYKNHLEIKKSIVNHPENLPTKETADNTSLWFKNVRADIYRLQAIQYIWWNAIHSEYKKYLYIMLDLITHLNPYFEHPYIIWEFLLPDYNQRYENLSEEEQKKYIMQGIQLWKKWIKNFCNMDKIELIKEESNLLKLWENDELKNPCKVYSIPYFLAYINYFYNKDPIEASLYYKIASMNEDAPEWSKIMAAIMQWKWWNREKSYFMFLNIAKSLNSNDEICLSYANTLEQIWVWVFYNKNINLDAKLIQQIEESRKNALWEFNSENEEKILSDMECANYVNKATRELNLAYIEQANESFKSDHEWRSAINAQGLYNEWYIDFLPTDFQQYEDYWIIYEYNKETWNYDYSMWKY